MPANLIETGTSGTRTHQLNEGVVRLGRAEDNDVVVASPHISEHHAEIAWDGTRHLIRDLGSKNGSFVNGERLSPSRTPSEKRALTDGDEVVLAGVRLVYRRPESTLTLTQRRGLVVDRDRLEVWVDGRRVMLPPKVFTAISVLDARRGKVVSRDEFARLVWPEHGGITSDDSIDDVLKKLRRALG